MNRTIKKPGSYRAKGIVLLSGVCLTLFVVNSSELRGNDLAENSPFVWEGYSPPQPPRPPTPPPPPPGPNPLDNVELRGVTVLGGQVYFSLFNSETQRGFWLRPDEMEAGFSVVDFDDGMDAVTLRHGDRTRSITLKESKIVALSSEEAQRRPAVPSPADGGNQRAQAGENRDQRLQEMAQQLRERREARRNILAGEVNN